MKTTNFNFANAFFMGWVLSLPFYNFSVVGTLSVDNLLAPIAIAMAPFAARGRGQESGVKRGGKVLLIVLLMGFYVLAQVISSVNSKTLIFSRLWFFAKIFGYFVLPVLYVKDIQSFRKIGLALVINSLLGCISVVLVSLGFLELEGARTEASRFGYDWLPKSVGFFTNYGDLAVLVSFSALFVIATRRRDLVSAVTSKGFKAFVLAILIVGMVAAQSRNVVLSLGVGLCSYLLFSWMVSAKTTGRRLLFFATVVPAFAVFLAVGGIYLSEIIGFIKGAGGRIALANAEARMESYRLGLALFWESPILGLGAESYRQYEGFVDQLHNMWLGVALRGGIISLFALSFAFFTGFAGAMRRFDEVEIGKEARMVGAAICSMFTSSLFYPGQSSYLFWFMFGFMLTLITMSESQHKKGRDVEK